MEGYNVCKMISLGQKLKMPKTCGKPFYNNIRDVLCKKPLKKNNKYSRNETILKMGHLSKVIAHATPFQNGQFGSKIKNSKNM